MRTDSSPLVPGGDSPALGALEAEISVLGAALQDARAAETVLHTLRDTDLEKDSHRQILAAIRTVKSRGDIPDALLVAKELERRKCLFEVGGGSYLALLVDQVPTTANVTAHCRLVRDAAVRRKIRSQALALAEKVTQPDQDVGQVVTEHAAAIDAALGGGVAGTRTIAPVKFEAALKSWEKACDEHQETRLDTPYPDLTSYLDGGFGPGELVYIGARPSVGKTSLALEIARRASENGTGVLIVSREMIVRALVRRIVAQTVRIPARQVKRGELSPEEWKAYAKARDSLTGLPMWMTDEATSLRDIVGIVDHWAYTPALGLLVVDYLQLVRGTSRDRRQEVEEVSQGLKEIAVCARIPVLCLSSLRRAPADQRERRPALSDLRESGAIEHDADVVLLLHRELGKPETDVIVAKQRDGRVGTIALKFLSKFVAFEQAEGGAEKEQGRAGDR